MPKDEKIKWSKFRIPCEGPYKVGKAYTNNIVQLESLHKDDLGTVNVNNFLKIISQTYHSVVVHNGLCDSKLLSNLGILHKLNHGNFVGLPCVVISNLNPKIGDQNRRICNEIN
jgi:hypothetical protein